MTSTLPFFFFNPGEKMKIPTWHWTLELPSGFAQIIFHKKEKMSAHYEKPQRRRKHKAEMEEMRL